VEAVSGGAPPIILASASPRRQELLGLTGLSFEIVPSEMDEEGVTGAPAEVARVLAERKAEEVAARYPEALVLGADTVVTLDGAILGKPKDAADAHRMLATLSGRTHQVITGIALRGPGVSVSDAVSTDVTFRALSAAEIAAYVATGEPMDKAGAYALQGYAALFTPKIHGDYANVVGLPLCRLTALLRALGLSVLGDAESPPASS
jgi:septum formation protein